MPAGLQARVSANLNFFFRCSTGVLAPCSSFLRFTVLLVFAVHSAPHFSSATPRKAKTGNEMKLYFNCDCRELKLALLFLVLRAHLCGARKSWSQPCSLNSVTMAINGSAFLKYSVIPCLLPKISKTNHILRFFLFFQCQK